MCYLIDSDVYQENESEKSIAQMNDILEVYFLDDGTD